MAPQNHPLKLVLSVFPILICTLNGVDQIHDQRFVPPANHCKQFRKLSYGRFYRFDACLGKQVKVLDKAIEQ